MSKETFDILRFVSSGFVLIPLLYILFRKERLSIVQRKLCALLVALLVVEVSSTILWFLKITNLPIYHVFTVIEFLLILNIYSAVLTKMITKNGIYALGVSFFLFSCFNVLFIQSIFVFNSVPIVIHSILVILITFISLYNILKDPQYTLLNNNSLFWISAGLLIYFSSSLVLFYIVNSLELTQLESHTIWGLHAIINILLILFYMRALWVQQEKE